MIRHASGLSPEELSLLDAYQDGYRAGLKSHAAGLNPWDVRTAQHEEWARGHRNATAAWLNHFKRA